MTESNPGDPQDPLIFKGDTAMSLRVVPSQDLLQGGQEILIRHGCEVYRLRVTRAGKLILTK